MIRSIFFFFCVLISSTTYSQSFDGFFNFEYTPDTGKVLLEVSNLDQEFLMVASIGAGLGSNDVGLDRGKLNGEKVVKFEKHGNKLVLIQSNLGFRAISDNPEERKAVAEAFATSVLQTFKIEKKKGNSYWIDLSAFLCLDHNNIASTLKRTKQGSYKISKEKSVIYSNGFLAFPNNVEFESLITFEGDPTGGFVKSVTPDPENVTIRQHISFIKLPDDGYRPRKFHPQSGYYPLKYYDYALPINEDIVTRLITRHRLEKKDPNAEKSEVKEPIIYYVDRGCPEPIKSALIEGASWWNEAFEAAGFVNAFQVTEMPEGAHPLDVRYNVIQWVHRSTRGWSYGGSITDPRTGEILKGHVSLGSLRVRQDYMIAQGVLSPFGETDDDTKLTEIALTRLRQLSAHEVGHTIGLAHNFAASTNDRSSVMDYPHPIFNEYDLDDISKVYSTGIGKWDIRAVIYGYANANSDQTEEQFLDQVIKENKRLNLRFITDSDARPEGSSHPYAHLWDIGENALVSLSKITKIREKSLKNFGLRTIQNGTPLSSLEKILVPIYFGHRYQAEAVSKLIGGADYEYLIKGDDLKSPYRKVESEQQVAALNALISLTDTDYLSLSPQIKSLLMPSAFGYEQNRESLPSRVGFGVDEHMMMESAIQHVFSLLLNGQRLNRVYQQGDFYGKKDYLSYILQLIQPLASGYSDCGAIRMDIFVRELIRKWNDKDINIPVKRAIFNILMDLDESKTLPYFISFTINQFINGDLDLSTLPKEASLPPGSPIGSEACHWDNPSH